jgi:hypothetical protein
MKELRVILYGVAILSAMFAAYLSFQTELIEDHPSMLQKNLGSDSLIDTSKDVKTPEQENVLPEPETKLKGSPFEDYAKIVATWTEDEIKQGLTREQARHYHLNLRTKFKINILLLHFQKKSTIIRR